MQGPFDPLPQCPPGMLLGSSGLPARAGEIVSEEWLRARPSVNSLPRDGSVVLPTISDDEYPFRVDWDGILADDEGYRDDIVTRVRDVLALLWGERGAAIEDEACQILGVRSLREWFRNPRQFWAFHIKRYSKSRRKAPIYWLLQSKKRHYGLWLYYPRIDADTLHKALAYANEKVAREEGRLAEAQAAAPAAEGRQKREAEKRAEAHEEVLADVAAFRDELRRVADQGLVPDHDDGVLLSIAPLHALVPWPEAKKVWAELVSGKYEWSSMGRQMGERGLVLGGGGGRGR